MELTYMCNFKACTFILIENYNGHFSFGDEKNLENYNVI